MKKVFVLAEHSGGTYHGSAYIRLIQPLSRQSICADYDVRFGYELPDEELDIVITERFWSSSTTMAQARALVDRIKSRSCSLIYELDDDLLDFFWDEPWIQAVTEERRAMVRLFLREADVAMISTPQLADRVRPLCRRVFVLPNAIDETLYPTEDVICQKWIGRPQRELIKFGYMGTPTHTSDLMMILEPLRQILCKYTGRVEFQIAQATHDPRIQRALEGLPFRVLDPGAAADYLAFVRWEAEHMDWDFGIAPLTDSSLNHSKSDLKFIEYGILGIPGVYSTGPSYSPSVEHMQNGILCASDPQSWFDALSLMIEDAELRRRLAANALQHVHAHRTLARTIGNWRAVLDCGTNRSVHLHP